MDDDFDHIPPQHPLPVDPNPPSSLDIVESSIDPHTPPPDTTPSVDIDFNHPHTPPVTTTVEPISTQISKPTLPPRRSTRISHPPSHLVDYICNLSTSTPE
jgi:hypothetical protein